MRLQHMLAAAAAPALIAAALPVRAAGPDIASYSLDTRVTVLNDERTRGVSDSLMKPAVKLGVEFAHQSGFVAVADIVNVSTKSFMNGNGTDITVGAGYRWGNPDAWHFGLGLAAEIFPGAKFNAPHGFDMNTFTPTDFRDTSYNSRFAVIEIGWGNLQGRILDVVSRTYRGADTGGVCGQLLQFEQFTDPTPALECYARGDHDSRGTLLYDLDYTIGIAPATKLVLHAGRQKVANFREADFDDYRIGITHKHWGFDWNADYVTTHNKVRDMYLVQDGDTARATDNSKLVLSVSRRF